MWRAQHILQPAGRGDSRPPLEIQSVNRDHLWVLLPMMYVLCECTQGGKVLSLEHGECQAPDVIPK